MSHNLINAVRVKTNDTLCLTMHALGSREEYSYEEYTKKIYTIYNDRMSREEYLKTVTKDMVGNYDVEYAWRSRPVYTEFILSTKWGIDFRIDMYPVKPNWNDLLLLSKLNKDQAARVHDICHMITAENYKLVFGLIRAMV